MRIFLNFGVLLALICGQLAAQQTIPTSWTSLGGPSGVVNQMAQQTSTTYYAATNNGLYKSVNTGSSWSRLASLADRMVVQVACDGSNLLAVVQDRTPYYSYFVRNMYYLMRSTNGGTTFAAVDSVDASYSIFGDCGLNEWQVRLYKKQTSQYFFNVFRGYCYNAGASFISKRSNNGGQTWTQSSCTTPLQNQGIDNCLLPTDMTFKGDTIVSARGNKILYSTNGGSSYTAYTNNIPSSTGVPAFNFKRVWFIGLNGANTLIRTSNFIDYTSYAPSVLASDETIKSLHVRSNVLYMLTNKALYKATDVDGTAFTAVFTSVEKDIVAAWFHDSSIWVDEVDGRLMRSANGTAWAQTTRGLNNASVGSLYDLGDRIVTTGADLDRYILSTGLWAEQSQTGIYDQFFRFTQFGGTVFAVSGYSGQNAKRSTNNGGSWVTMPYPFFDIRQNGSARLFGNANNGKSYFSDNLGVSWTEIPGGNGNVVYIKGNEVYRINGGLWYSGNLGATWSQVTPPAAFNVFDMVVLSNGVVVMYSFQGATQVSTNQGQTWQAVGSNVPGAGGYYSGGAWVPSMQNIDSLLILNFGGDEGGMFASKDYGKHWGKISKHGIFLRKNDDIYVSPTYGGGVYRTSYSGLLAALNFSDLTLTQEAPPVVSVLSNYQLKLTVANKGTLPTSGVQVKTNLPATTTFNIVEMSQGSYTAADNAGFWNIGNLGGDSSASLVLLVYAYDTASYFSPDTIFSQIWTASPAEQDNTPGNDTNKTPNEDDEALTTIQVVPSAVDLSLTAETSTQNINLGDTLTVYVRLKNADGFQTATGVAVKFTNNSLWQLVSTTTTAGSFNSGTGIWTVGSVIPFTEQVLTVKLKGIGTSTASPCWFEVSACNEYDYDSTPNDGGVASDDYDEVPLTPATCYFVQQMSADLSADTVTYILDLTKYGAAIPSTLSVKDKLPTGMNFAGIVFDNTADTYQPSTGIWTIADETAPNHRLKIKAVKTAGTTTVTNFAQVWAVSPSLIVAGSGANQTPGNNPGNTPTEQDEAALTLNVANPVTDLALTMQTSLSDNGAYYYYSAIYTVTNQSSQYADNIVVKYQVPAAATQVYSLDGNYNNPGFLYIGDLPAGASHTGQLTFYLPDSATVGTVFLQVWSVFPLSDADSAPGNDTNQTANEDDEALDVLQLSNQVPDYTCNITAWPSSSPTNTPQNVTVEATNLGPGNGGYFSASIYVSSDNALDASDPVVGNVYFDVATVGQTVSATGTLNFPIGQSTGGHFLFAKVNPSQVLTEANYANNISTSRQVTLLQPVIDLSLTSTISGPTPLLPNDTITYTLICSAQALNQTASNVQVKAPLPAGWTFISATAGAGSYNTSTSNWNIGNMPPAAYYTCTIKCKAATAGTYNTFAQVWTASPADFDSAPGNDTNNTANEDDEAASTITVSSGVNAPDLSLTLSSSSGTLPIYTNITFTLTATNSGTVTANDVTVKFLKTASFAYTSQAGDGTYSDWTGIWNIGSIAPGQTKTKQVVLFVLNTAPVTMFAQVQTQTPADLDSTPGNDTNNTANEDDEAAVNLPFNLLVMADAATDFGLPFPNPTDGLVSIMVGAASETDAVLSVFDAQGRQIGLTRHALSAGNNLLQLDLGQYPAGLYRLRLSTDGLPARDFNIVRR